MNNIGIILAGGAGSRLYPLTNVTCKQLLPVYDKPMIYYPLSTLMLAGIYDILIITTEKDLPHFQSILGDGSHLGIFITYKIQEKPRGIAEAILIGEDIISNMGDNEKFALILGDNIFHGNLDFLRSALHSNSNDSSYIFSYKVKDPERYGVVEIDPVSKDILSLEEKPIKPKSFNAVTGVYVYTNEVVDICKNLQPSARGEIEITDLNKELLKRSKLKVKQLSRGMAWLDTGTHSSLIEASNYIEAVENRQGLKVGCIEEVAYTQGYINKEQFYHLLDKMPNTEYKQYLSHIGYEKYY